MVPNIGQSRPASREAVDIMNTQYAVMSDPPKIPECAASIASSVVPLDSAAPAAAAAADA